MASVNAFWKDQITLLSAYHPQTDGQTEVVNRSLEQYLHAFTSDHPNQWHAYLPLAELCYNTTFHSVIGMTLLQALYGPNPKLLLVYNPGVVTAEKVDLALSTNHQIQAQLQDYLAKA